MASTSTATSTPTKSPRKLPRDLENPVDSVLMDVADRLQPAFRATGHTPNALTTYSLAFGALAVWAAVRRRAALFAVAWTVSYYFDCADGHFARTYGMTTKFGDYYDHFKDYAVTLSLAAALVVGRVLPAWAWGALGLAVLLATVHMGCQQRYRDRPDGMLDALKPLCPDAGSLRLTRFVGMGTFNALLVVVVAYYLAVAPRKP